MTEQNLPTHGRFVNLNGRTFGRLKIVKFGGMVVEKRGNRTGRRAAWICRCECGKVVRAIAHNLLNGHTQSCGCLVIDRTKESNTRHGHSRVGQRSPEYKCWASMIARCTNPNCKQWDDYGGRGIKVCERWMTFENFVADIPPRSPGTSLDRFPDFNGNYEPGNVRWATTKEQNRNKRNNRRFAIGGESLCLAECAERYGMDQDLVWARLERGWSIEKALETSVDSTKASGILVEFNGKRQGLVQHAAEHGIECMTVRARLQRGWSLAKALTTPTGPNGKKGKRKLA